MIEFKINGMAELKRQMEELPAIIEGRITQIALRRSAEVVADDVRQRLRQQNSVQSGELLKSVRVQLRGKDKKFGKVRFHVKVGNRAAYYPYWLEYGTAKHLISATNKPKYFKGGRVREVSIKTLNRQIKAGVLSVNGQILGTTVIHPGAKAKPFMRPAINAKTPAAVERFVEVVRERLPREIRRQARLQKAAA